MTDLPVIPSNESQARALFSASRENTSKAIIPVLRACVPRGASVLELGSGSGRDLRWLARYFRVEGSDASAFVVRLLRKEFPNIDIHEINAEDLGGLDGYDLIFSNKVLHHLSENTLSESISSQRKSLKKGGRIFHTFWRHGNLSLEKIRSLFCESFRDAETGCFGELLDADSFYVSAIKP